VRELTFAELDAQLAEQLPPRELMSTYNGRKKWGGGTNQFAAAQGGDGGNGGNGGLGVNVGVNALNGNQVVPIAIGGDNISANNGQTQNAGNGGNGGNGGGALALNFAD
jgi:hypothetical protein